MIHLDTSFLIRAGARDTVEGRRLRTWIGKHERLALSAVVWAEYVCGPIESDAVEAAAELFGEPEPLTGIVATLAAELFDRSGRRRGTLADCMIAATAMHAGAVLATSNRADFERFTAFGLALASS